MSPKRFGFAALVAAVACVTLCAGGALAQEDIAARASVTPRVAHIGEPVRYRGELLEPASLHLQFLPPDTSEAFEWGTLTTARHPSRTGLDTLVVEATLQAFALGPLAVPGVAFRDRTGSPDLVRNLPTVEMTIVPVIAPGDSAADLKPVRGPLAAPWWEMIPWAWVIAISGLAGLVTWLLMRRRREVVLVSQPARPLDATAKALDQLARLRARRLPEAGEFALHALELTAILRRFLEATTVRLRPGCSTAELSRRLGDEAVPAGEALVLVSLLRVWDRVKFARAPFTLDEARKSEDAVEAYVKRHRPAPAGAPGAGATSRTGSEAA